MAATPHTPASTRTREYVRFTRLRRAEHLSLILSFTALALTGLPQKFVGIGWAETTIGWMGGIENVRLLHHAAAIFLLFICGVEVLIAGYKLWVERASPTIVPRVQDAVDAWHHFLFNVGLRREAPRYHRYSWMEKFEYWALVWGTLIMALTGFVLWNPILSTKFLPGEIIPAAKAAHGGEAILAVLAVLLWHGYHVHLRRFNRSMLTGTLSAEEMSEEHPLELKELETTPERVTPVGVRRRRRVYMPLAGALGIVFILGIYLFATTETTAITTVSPDMPTRQAFVPRTFTPTATRVPSGTPIPPTPKPTVLPVPGAPVANAEPSIPFLPISHEGRTTCNVCHGSGFDGAPVNPTDHEGREDSTCTLCHVLESFSQGDVPDAVNASPPVMPISHEGRTTCLACHVSGFDGAPVNPEDHEGREESTCTVCHLLESLGVGDAQDSVTVEPPIAPTLSITATLVAGTQPAASSPDSCLECHGPFEKLVSASENFVWANGTQASPHTFVPHDSNVIPACTKCHEPHPLPPTASDIAAMSQPNPQYCYSCHHTGALECGTCHEIPETCNDLGSLCGP